MRSHVTRATARAALLLTAAGTFTVLGAGNAVANGPDGVCPPPFATIPVEPGRPIPIFANGSTDRCAMDTPAGTLGTDDKSSADPSGLGGEPPRGR